MLYGLNSDKSLSRVQLFVTPWTGARQAPLSIEFSRQEYWSGLPFPPPGLNSISPPNSFDGVLTPSTSDSDHIWK